jgi:hypothetical protein
MAYSVRRSATHNKETKKAEQLAKLLTEDFSIDLERIGYYLVRNLPLIVFHRFDVLALSAQEEYDILRKEMEGNHGFRR